MEQFFLDNRRYDDGGGKCGIPDPATVASDAFAIGCAIAGNGYTVTATGQAGASMSAFVYEITQNGTKTSKSLPGGWTATANCWVVRKDGSCV
jgi:type IV pilus assembly protein PilE